ncbi:MAG TPA: hypothetical protein VFN23_00665 [Ktedonobacteraceae bacterium]|nr:hypothetical protein [Ktedonobacteraceae bacterium]
MSRNKQNKHFQHSNNLNSGNPAAKTPYQHEQEQLKIAIRSQKLALFERLMMMEHDALLVNYTRPSVSGGLALVQGHLAFSPEATRLLQHLYSEEYRLEACEKAFPAQLAKVTKELDDLEQQLPTDFSEKRRRYEFLARHVFFLEQSLTEVEKHIADARATIEATKYLAPQQQQQLIQQIPSVIAQIMATSRTSYAEMQYAQQKHQLQSMQAQALHALLTFLQEAARKSALIQLLNERRALRDKFLQEMTRSHL